MAYDKVVDSAVLDAGLTSIADEIRAKGGTTDTMSFPDGMVNAIAAIETGGSSVSTWKNVQQIVQAGEGATQFPIGTQFQVSTQSYGTLLFDVVAHDHHKNPNDETAHTMTLMMHDVITGSEFDAAEWMWTNTKKELSATTFYFSTNFSTYTNNSTENTTLKGTTTKAIPVGGGIRHATMGMQHNTYSSTNLLQTNGGLFTTYDADGNVIEKDIKCYQSSGTTSLGTISNFQKYIYNSYGTFNSSVRQQYGSSNWKESNIRQWLNAEKSTDWWEKQTLFDCKPASTNKKGFLANLDPEFVAVIGPVENITARNSDFEADGILGGSYTTLDKMFLPSITEIGGGDNNGVAEGSVMSYYNEATSTDLIKYSYSDTTRSTSWTLRSARLDETPSPVLVYQISTSGGKSSFIAQYVPGVAAACVIY